MMSKNSKPVCVVCPSKYRTGGQAKVLSIALLQAKNRTQRPYVLSEYFPSKPDDFQNIILFRPEFAERYPYLKFEDHKGFFLDNVIPVYEPSAVLRKSDRWLEFKAHIFKAFKYPEPLIPQLIVEQPDTFLEVIQNSDVVAVDIEISKKTKDLLSFGVSGNGQAVSITAETFYSLLPHIADFLRDESKKKVFWNASFDVAYLKQVLRLDVRNYEDVMIYHRILFSDVSKSLKYASSLVLPVKAWKHTSSEDLLTYNAMDCWTTEQLYLIYRDRTQDLQSIIKQKHCELQNAITMSLRGFSLDTKRRNAFLEELIQERLKLEQTINEKFPETVGLNLNSPAQLKRLLYEVWHLPPQTVKGKVSVGSEAILKLKQFLRKSRHLSKYLEFLQLYEQWKELKSLESKELRLEPNPDGRIYTTYNVVGTISARWSSSSPIYLSGVNIQNRKKRFRAMYLPPEPDFVFLSSDYSGAEAYIVAWRCGDEITKEAFLKGQDIHKLTASLMFGKPVDQVSKEERTVAKRIRHASNYDMSYRKLALLMDISPTYAKALLEKYHSVYPKVRAVFHTQTRQLVQTTRKLEDAWGLPLYFTKYYLSDEDIRTAYSFYPQSTCTHTLNKALCRIAQQIRTEGLEEHIFIQAQIHDELLLCVRKDPEILEKAFEILKWGMRLEIPIVNLETQKVDPLVLKFDFKVGLNWGEMVEFSEQDDVRKIFKEVCDAN